MAGNPHELDRSRVYNVCVQHKILSSVDITSSIGQSLNLPMVVPLHFRVLRGHTGKLGVQSGRRPSYE
ncbi:hypothetical protein DPMN_176502 [Dreissena polymorpha]|uniref:Uncharacterized protein n=1 Tax=Dreissena polymorpha TaxID=45954 RepID=A0A9D4E9L8_DREPO|nr:hypothetical protein DPMN_176502 [Dreissena polymorpha]